MMGSCFLPRPQNKSPFLRKAFYGQPKAAHPPASQSLSHIPHTRYPRALHTPRWSCSWPVYHNGIYLPPLEEWKLYGDRGPAEPVHGWIPVPSAWQMADVQKTFMKWSNKRWRNEFSVFSAPQIGKDAMQALSCRWLNKVLKSETTALHNSSPDCAEQPKFKRMC